MLPINALLVDDEPLARSLLRTLLADFPAVHVSAEAGTGREALAALQTATYDLVFLDVQMPDFTGIEVVHQLSVNGVPLPLVVFVTAYEHYAVQAFAQHAVDYLLKPLDPDRFAECLVRVQERLAHRHSHAVRTQLAALLTAWPVAHTMPPFTAATPNIPVFQDRFLVKTAERNFFVPTAEVLYLEATGNTVTLHTLKERYIVRASLGQLESRLNPARFLRIHRSCLLNTDHIREFKHWAHGEYVFRLANGAHVTSSRSYRPSIQQFLKHLA